MRALSGVPLAAKAAQLDRADRAAIGMTFAARTGLIRPSGFKLRDQTHYLRICFASPPARAYGLAMDFDDLLARYFGTAALGELPPAAREAGIERMLVDFGLSRDRGQRFALWSVLYLMGAGPDLEAAFPDPADRDAARNFMDMMAAADGEIGL